MDAERICGTQVFAAETGEVNYALPGRRNWPSQPVGMLPAKRRPGFTNSKGRTEAPQRRWQE